MQLKFITLGLTAAVLITTVNAFVERASNLGVSSYATLDGLGSYIAGPPTDANTAREKRSPSASKKVASAIRRRAMARRGEEADEEEEDEDENEDEEQDSTEEDATEEDVAEDDEYANNEEGNTEDEETGEDVESDDSKLERRTSVINGLPVVGGLLGGDQSTGKDSGDILGAL